MNNQKYNFTPTQSFFVLAILIAAFVGWILNIVAIVGHDFATEIGFGVVRVIGVFIPIIGAVLGYV
jgi:hypothetical protein